jgi:hypothetical protein
MLRSFCAMADARIFLYKYPEQNTLSQHFDALEDRDIFRSFPSVKNPLPSDLDFDGPEVAFCREPTGIMLEPENIRFQRAEIAWDKGRIKGRELEELQIAADPLIRDLRRRNESWLASPRFYRQKSMKVRGVIYTDSSSPAMGDSIVFYQPYNSSLFVPGRIRHIGWVPVPIEGGSESYHKKYFFACQRFLEAPTLEVSKFSYLFSASPEFKLSLQADKFNTEIEVFPANSRICHANMAAWCPEVVVLKQLDRVSVFSALE